MVNERPRLSTSQLLRECKLAGRLVLIDSERKRLTGGITLSLQRPFISDIRINYEKYFYPDNALIHVSEQDKFVIEFMTRFNSSLV